MFCVQSERSSCAGDYLKVLVNMFPECRCRINRPIQAHAWSRTEETTEFHSVRQVAYNQLRADNQS